MLFMAVVSIAFGWFAYERNRNTRQEQAVAALRKMRAIVWYDYQLQVEAQKYQDRDVKQFLSFARDSRRCAAGLSKAGMLAQPDVSAWLRGALGKDYGSDVSLVFLDHYVASQGDIGEAWKLVSALPRLKALYAQKLDLSRIDLAELESLKQLTHLQLYQAQLSDRSLIPIGQAEKIESLDLCENSIEGTILAQLARLPNLTELNLSHNPLEPKHLRLLRNFRDLKFLNLAGTSLGDEAVDDLVAMPNLQSLNLNGTRLTDYGVARLLKHPSLQSLTVYDAPDVSQEMRWLVQDQLGRTVASSTPRAMGGGLSSGAGSMSKSR